MLGVVVHNLPTVPVIEGDGPGAEELQLLEYTAPLGRRAAAGRGERKDVRARCWEAR